MATITDDYLQTLPEIYKDVLAAFRTLDPARMVGEGLAYQSLFTALNGKYSLGQVHAACRELAKGGAVEFKNEIFVHPTMMGENLIEAITGYPPAQLPPFSPPPP